MPLGEPSQLVRFGSWVGAGLVPARLRGSAGLCASLR